MTGPAFTALNKFAKQHGCRAHKHPLTPAEQAASSLCASLRAALALAHTDVR